MMDSVGMTQILLVGPNAPLLEGLAQSLAALGASPHVVSSLTEARELALAIRPLVAVIDRELTSLTSGEGFGLSLAPGGVIVLYRSMSTNAVEALPPAIQRQVLAELALPLERNRLVALVQSIAERARAAGRGYSESDEVGDQLRR